MSNITVERKRLQGEVLLPADKSISHRAVIIGSLAKGKTRIKNLSSCEDCISSVDAFRKMGISISKDSDSFTIEGKGLDGLRKPEAQLYLGNSGTSMRLISGVLAGQNFDAVLAGDASLCRRPMKRIIKPLSLMGAKIAGAGGGEFAPLSIHGRPLKAIAYDAPVASAQVKSAVLLAGLYASGTTLVRELVKTRDHTERMLKRFEADISVKGLAVSVKGRPELISKEVQVPADISAASFFLVGACISKDSQIKINSVGLNPTRTAFLGILQKIGAKLSIGYQNNEMAQKDYDDEPQGEIAATYSHLAGFTILPNEVPLIIDELPILMVAATQAEGKTVIRGAGELRVKETDRIEAMVSNLSRLGADIRSEDNDIIICGPARLKGATVDSFGDHRVAMCMAIAGLVARGRTCIQDADCVNVSFPGFFKKLSHLLH